MNSGKTLVPKLRFPGFEGNWETKYLKDISVLNPSNVTLPEEFIYIDLESVNDGILSKEQTVNKSDAPSRAQRKLEKNDILYQMVRPYQKNNFFFNRNGNFVASTGYAQIRAKQNSAFLFQYLHFQNFVDKVIEKCTGSNYPAINSGDLSRIEVSIPGDKEQNKIADFLIGINEKFKDLKKKKALLEKYKKGMMQKFFNQELRFKDDDGKDFGEWNQNQLSEIIDLLHGYQFRSEDFTSSGLAIIKISNVIGSGLNLQDLSFIDKKRHEQFKQFEIHIGDILMSLTGNIGRVVQVNEVPFKMIQNYRVGKFVPIDPNIISKEFTKYLLVTDMVFGRFDQLSNQSAQANFGKQDMDKITVWFPSLIEQTKIANFLSAIDEKINHVAVQIEKMEVWKKGLLGEMFV